MADKNLLVDDFDIITYDDVKDMTTEPVVEEVKEEVVSPPEPRLVYVSNSDMYVISVNNVPKFYENTETEARERIWQLLRNFEEKHPDWVYDTYKRGANQYIIARIYKWFLIQYEDEYCCISLNRVRKITSKCD